MALFLATPYMHVQHTNSHLCRGLMQTRTRRLISSARERPTREVMLRRGVSCLRDLTRMEEAGLVDGAVVDVSFEETVMVDE